MKKIKSILLLTASILLLTACGIEKETTNFAKISENETSETQVNLNDYSVANDSVTIDGGVVVDGLSIPVNISIGIENVAKGEEAYNYLHEHDTELKPADDNHEYIVATLKVTYNDGELDPLRIIENRATADGMSLYFALPNESSNATDLTSSLENPIYSLALQKGESGTGDVAFLQEKDNTNELYFVFYDKIVTFKVQ